MYHLSLCRSTLAVFFLCSSISIAQQTSSNDLSFVPRVTANIPSIALKIHESSHCMFPLLVLYFDGAGSTTIPESYQIFSTSSQADLYTDTSATYFGTPSLQKYYQLLNIVGYRMRLNPAIILELQGGYSAEADESPHVAITRAETVREYLNDIWGISTDRIALREPKQFCSSSDPKHLQEEARAVRFHSQNPDLFSRICYRNIRRRITHNPFPMRIHVDPWIRRKLIDSVVISVCVGDSVLSRSVLGRPLEEYEFSDRVNQATGDGEDIPRYVLRGQWLIPPQIGDTQDGPIEILTAVHLKSGEIRTGNTVREQIQMHYAPESPHNTTWISLPGFEEGDTARNAQHRMWMHEVLERAARIGVQGSSFKTEGTTTPPGTGKGHREKYTQTEYLEVESGTFLFSRKDADTYYHSQSWLWDCEPPYYISIGSNPLSNNRAKAVQSWISQQGYSWLAVEVEDGTITVDPEEFDLPEKRAYLRGVRLEIQPPLER